VPNVFDLARNAEERQVLNSTPDKKLGGRSRRRQICLRIG
jgi:hypothetical protein